MLHSYYNGMTGKFYDNRYDAIVDKFHNNQSVLFYYRDNEYERVNWLIEPKETLNQLYKERAQQIRDTYDHVVICYSGGIDSTNVLETFYYNNIHIDEIVCVGSFSQDTSGDIDQNHNKDIYSNVVPTLNMMHLPNTKKTFLDYTTYFNNLSNFSLYNDYGIEYYKYIGFYPSVTYLFWYDLPKFLNLKKNSVIIYGVEKPFPHIDDKGKFYFEFTDASMMSYSKYDINSYARVNFYSDPESEKIILKQHHLIKNYYSELFSMGMINCRESFTKKNSKYLDVIHKIIYDTKNPLTYVSKKGSNSFLSVRDSYLPKKKNSDIWNFYGKSISHMIKNYNINIGTKYTFSTKRYYIT